MVPEPDFCYPNPSLFLEVQLKRVKWVESFGKLKFFSRFPSFGKLLTIFQHLTLEQGSDDIYASKVLRYTLKNRQKWPPN